MSSISRIEEYLEEQDALVTTDTNDSTRARRIVPRLTLELQQVKDENKTITVRTGLTEQEFYYVLSLLQEEPQPIRRGRELLDLDIRLVVFLQWLRTGYSYKAMGESFGLHRCRIQSIITDLWTPLITALRRNLLPRSPRDYHSDKRFDNYPPSNWRPRCDADKNTQTSE